MRTAATRCTVGGSTTRTPGWSGSTTRRPRRGSRRRRPSRTRVLRRGAGTRLAAGRGRSLGALRAAVAADSAPGRTDASSSGRPTPATRSSSSCCGATQGAPLEAVLDPNTWPSDEVLVFAVPSPDGALVAFGKAVGGTHDARDPRARRRDGAAASRPAARHEPRVAGLAARRVGVLLRGVSRAGRGAAGRGGALERHLRAPARVGRAGPPGLRRRPREGRTGARSRSASAAASPCSTSGTSSMPTSSTCCASPTTRCCRWRPEMRSLNQVQVIGDALLIHTDLDAPRGRCCVASLAAPTEWRTLIPEGPDTLQTVDRHRRPAVRRLLARRVASRAHPRRGRQPICATSTLPALGSVDRDEGPASSAASAAPGAATRCGWTSSRTCSRRRSTATTTRPTA